ncbi:dihydrofolate reductase [Bacteroides sp. OF04-15BH]|uniref:dipeptidyl-peptidase 3 family protein n=1 Tax=Bacteroides sp. OF04-15BH TaxID=2292281 RepID=UPI000E503B6B|nr:dihydrofolate reductase [Bacteroides sp. OF04-15BH]RHP61230.1 dihydrofolate reductase [Bacteroides sp. OF04-15BH]
MNTTDFSYCDERFADLQLLRYRVNGFENLDLRQKKLVYYLSQAALYGRDILWDQNGKFNLKIRKTLEAIYTDYSGDRNSKNFQELTVYLKRVWFSNGIHHHYACDKFPALFSESFFKEALLNINPEKLPLKAGETAETLYNEIAPVIFNPAIMAKRVNQADGEDLLLTSACNYYAEGITQKEAEDFYQEMKNREQDPRPVMYGLNSQLVRKNGKIAEEVWKIDGMYGKAIEKIVYWLEKAAEVSENPKQKEVILKLVEFYKTGNLRTFDEYSILWIQEQDGFIDFTNGFIETYGDPLGMKASWEGYVNLKDAEATERTRKLSENAQWFEDHSPVDARFKKDNCQGVSAKVIETAILGGDLYPASAIGINLPNSNWIRAEHGSKSVTIGNLTHAYNQAAHGNGFKEEFVINREVLELMEKYEDVCDDLHTDLHECLGHGSGKMLPGVDPDSLKAYGATIEEARADLFGLYYLADPKLTELGLTPDSEAYKAQYYGYLMNGLLTQLVRINPGKDIEEAHMRNRALIARWALEMGKEEQIIEMICLNRKTYVQINDYQKLREIFGKQLAEIQRIKSEGDLEAARQLVERYGVKVDPSLHQEILARYNQLNLAPYKGFINPVYTPVIDEQNNITDIRISYGEAYDKQMLRYSKDYATL